MRDEPMRPECLKARLLRALSGMSQTEIGRKIGRGSSHVDQWEQGLAAPAEDDLKLLAERGAGITAEDAAELLRLYETQRKAFQRKGIEASLDDLAERLRRHCAAAVRRLTRLELPERPPSAEDRREAEARFEELSRLDDPSRLALVRLNGEFQTWALAERCCAESERETSRNPERAASWARLALAITGAVKAPEAWHRRLRGHALAHWADVLEIRGELKTAQVCRARARELHSTGSDPAVVQSEAKLRRNPRRTVRRRKE